MRIHLKKPASWKAAYIHLWDDKNPEKLQTKWPGIRLKKGRDGWHTHQIKGRKNVCFVLTDGKGSQTEDYYLDKAEAWYVDGDLWTIKPNHYDFFTFPNGMKKALGMSYDDGVIQDIRLTRMFTKYGIKGTFHINSGVMDDPSKVPAELAKPVYKGHEISMHSSTHPFLYHATEEHIRAEIYDEKKRLEKLLRRKMIGMSYPFGSYNLTMLKRMKEWGLVYGRVVPETNDFRLPGDLLRWRPSVHHCQSQEITNRFLAEDGSKLSLFLIWGHSWEFDDPNSEYNWTFMEGICQQLSGHKDIWYASMGEIALYLKTLEAVEVSDDGQVFSNNSEHTVWINHDGHGVPLQSGETVAYS
ncbi:polysaccharide deacetylase family protein [Vibrio mangrovi]|uniref:Polysaccharide deacetylase n=1 Tax=Vibrio mangrovi TaxID=474394 RepID=A0A1Y6ITF2_9VIBR|nr:polysaccharide deacetylase family protein [Vibrio mangrovi]MDW6004669.1 polysaccharide deacetylase family protein [Vibrio mangrovi]SMS00959.1 Polysaccharide deacetylase [Vibrio mangrovi]